MKFKINLLLIIWLLCTTMKAQYAVSNFTMISHVTPEATSNSSGNKYSGCWGWYQASKNKEYAIACSHRGTYWIDVTVPATPTVSAYRAGKKSGCTWREAKSYLNYLYVISDDFGANSFQIFDMQYLPDSVHKVYDGTTLFTTAHTLWVDGNKLYIAGSAGSSTNSAMSVYSLANPASPTLLRKLSQDYSFINYVHDMHVRRDTIFASCGYQGLYVFKLTSSNTFTQLGSLTSYPSSGYNHSSALTPNGQTLVFLDEVPAGLPVKVANVTNLSNIQVLATTNQFTPTTPHNPFVVNNQYCFVSAYQDGTQLFDISNPSSPSLVGYFDTYPQGGGNINSYPTNADYNGQWGCYPFLPSGNIFALDMLNGVFMLKTSSYQTPPVVAGINSPTLTCVNSNINLVSNSTGANTFTWTFPQGAISSVTLGSASISFTSIGIYTVNLLAENSSFSSSVTQTITVANVNATVTSSNASCSSCSNGAATVTPGGGTSPYTYTWTPFVSSAATANNLAPGCYTVNITDANGCAASVSTCVSYNSTVGLPVNLSQVSKIDIFPNPAHTELNINYPDIVFDYSIYSASGQLISNSNNNNGKAVIRLDEYPKGLYIVEVDDGNQKIRKHIVKE
jgi:choice-of-anchor B domain-containing protein